LNHVRIYQKEKGKDKDGQGHSQQGHELSRPCFLQIAACLYCYGADEFHDILFSVGPGSYGEDEPSDPSDLVSEEYPANEQMYKEYIEYLLQQL